MAGENDECPTTITTTGTVDEDSIEDKQDNCPPAYQAFGDSSASLSYMEKKDLDTEADDQASFNDVVVDRSADIGSRLSDTKKGCRVNVLYVIISLVLSAGLISVLIYFILLHVNGQNTPKTYTSQRKEGLVHGATGDLPGKDVATGEVPESQSNAEDNKMQSTPGGSACCFNPCMNNGQCKKVNGTGGFPVFQCWCHHLFEGVICEKEKIKNQCEPNPCQNGGSCLITTSPPFYSCTCAPLYNGETCDERISFQQPTHTNIMLASCNTSPCKNGGTCQIERFGFSCFCAAGYTGQECEEAVLTETQEGP